MKPLDVSSGLKLNDAALASYPPGATYGPMPMRDFEWVWIVSGSAVWYVNDELHHLKPGDVALARPGDVQAFDWDRRQHTMHGYIHFSTEETFGAPHLVTGPQLQTIYSMLEQAVRLQKDGVSVDLVRTALRLSGTVAPDPTVDDDLMFGFRSIFAAEWLHTAMTSDAIAERLQISRSTLHRFCRQRLGHPPGIVIRMLRCEHALNLLLHTNMSVAEVSERCGYDDQFTFSRSFQSAIGCPPSYVRKNRQVPVECEPILLAIRRLVVTIRGERPVRVVRK